MKKRAVYIYPVYLGVTFSEYIRSFKSAKAAINFILSQDCPEDYCYEKIKIGETEKPKQKF